jgi:uncharacterized protein (DUF1330 family)
MSAFAVIEIKINDPEMYAQYRDKVKPIVEKYSGKYIIRGGKVTSFFGEWDPERIVVIEFPSTRHLKCCFSCPEYKEIAPLRENSTISKLIMIEGDSDVQS